MSDNSEPLTFAEFSRINKSRCSTWHPKFGTPEDTWNGADWSNAMCGEAGEAANVVKKLRRAETDAANFADKPPDELLQHLADEIGDTYAYLDLLATYYGIDIAKAIAEKFNAISLREGLPDHLMRTNV